MNKKYDYDSSTGVLRHRTTSSPRIKAGQAAGSVNSCGYVLVWFEGKKCQAHRLIWETLKGPIPDGCYIDHINGDKTDNRLENLRLASPSQNRFNSKQRSDNTSGYTGVHFNQASGKWSARLFVGGSPKHLGSFKCPTTAAIAYDTAIDRHNMSEFARYNLRTNK